MSIAHEFDYVKARTIKEALQLLAQPGAVLAGGTDLVAWLRDEPSVRPVWWTSRRCELRPASSRATLDWRKHHVC